MYQPFAHLTPRGKPYDLPPLPNTLKRGRKMEKLTYEHIKSVIKTADYLQHGCNRSQILGNVTAKSEKFFSAN